MPSGMAAMLERVVVSRERLESLLPGVLALTRSSVVVDKDEDSLRDSKGRLQASYILRGLSVRLLQDGSRAPDLIEAAVLGFRAAGHSSLDSDRRRKIAELMATPGQFESSGDGGGGSPWASKRLAQARMVWREMPVRRSISRWVLPARRSVQIVVCRCGFKTFTS